MHAIKYRTADSVLVTHGHFDHILDIPRLYKDSDTLIYATSTPCKTLMKRIMEREQLRVIIPGATFRLGNFTIQAADGAG